MKTGALALLIVLAATASPAAAQTADEGRQAFLDADLDGAARIFEAVAARADVEFSEMVEAQRYLAMLRLSLGDRRRARRHAALAVALDYEVEAPEGGGADVDALLDRARAELGDRRLRFVIDAHDDRRITARLTDAPDLFEELALRCAEDEAVGPPPEVSLQAPAGAVECRAEARTGAGAPLLVDELLLEADPGAAAIATGPAGGGGGLRTGLIVGGVGAAVLAVVLVGVLASRGSDDAVVVGAEVPDW